MLNQGQVKRIQQLQKQCEAHDGIHLKLDIEILRDREEEECDYFHYVDGRLAGYLALYPIDQEVELCGMVHPDYRRQGIMSLLLKRALKVIEKEKYKKILLNAPAKSVEAKAFFNQLPCDYSYTEYQLKWVKQEIADQDDHVSIRYATREDYQTEIQIDVECYGMSEKEAEEEYYELKQETGWRFYIIECDGVPIGKIRVEQNEDASWIYGFAIYPEFQGKGFGREALKKVLALEKGKNGIYIEVAATNRGALHLYQSCGFSIFEVQDYYEYRVN
ncbi:GNAT family N-acetyltransferase [Terrilactibacillus sp. BCM23-1]|uniref:GNAT family N-acetyltransferase n=1 Tax=Terrilactibacillus tamarindi TaxID=2599694 RepID=A0A6N8CWR8_9BACI|nr:GNAT family N-acetyltransferase [Terrilactibacillus tamarindi]MTT33196.1 GNAT family N-acetyltransferase [Terrilactibacillus tamarindi]